MNIKTIIARDLPDAWHQCLYSILDEGRVYTIDYGSFKGQKRLEFDYVTVQIKYPETRPLIPKLAPTLGVPDPVTDKYLEDYLPYLMTDKISENESYTYGKRIINQVDKVITMFKKEGFKTNQACIEVGRSEDLDLEDPACLRLIDCRIIDNKLHFITYFRSQDLYSGFPANFAAIQLLKEYMSSCIGVGAGETITSSKGLHLYDYTWDLAKTIRGRN